MNARSRCTAAAGLVAVSLAVGGAVSSTAAAGATTVVQPSVARPRAATFASACRSLRARYHGLPTSVDVAVSPFNPPSESANPKNPSQIVGLEPSIVNELGTCLGFTHTYTSEGFANVITSLQSGRDPLGITALYETPAREKIISFVTYRTAEDQIVTTPALVHKLHDPMSLCGLRTGVTTGSVESAYMQKLSGECTAAHKKAISISIYQDIGTVFLSVVQGHIDFTSNAAELTPAVVKQYPGKLTGGFLVKALSFTVGIGVARSRPELGHAVTAAMEAMQAAGIEKALLARWGYPVSTQLPAAYVP